MPNRQRPTRERQSPDWRRSGTTQPTTRFADPLFSYFTNCISRKPFLLITIRIARGVCPLCPLSSVLCAPNSGAACGVFFTCSLCFQQLAHSFSLLTLFLQARPFVFSGLRTLLQKHPGGGYQRGRGRSGGRAVSARGRMRKRGPNGGGTLRKESPQQGQRPSSQNARVASARSQ
jgi:hypothetical protein